MKKILMVLAVFIIFSGCNQEAQKESEREDENKVVVTTEKSVEKEYNPWLKYTGVSYPYREANLGTTLPGKVEKIVYEEGTYVKEGTLLVELSAELYAQALAEKSTLEKDYERVSRLREKGSISQQEYDHVKAKYEAAKAKTRMMKKNSEVRAPFSGTIVDYMVKEGENFMFSPSLKAGYSHTSGILKLMQLNELKVEFDVNEKELSRVKTGQDAKVVFDAYPDSQVTGKVTRIDPVLSTKTHTAKAEVTINNSEKKFKPGMYAKVHIKLPETTDVFVPLNSIYRQPGTGNNYVFVVNNNTVSKKPVDKLYTLHKEIAVKGIQGGLEIVVHGKNKLEDGDKVVIEND